ncbi:MAG: serine hydrolase [Candidatus Yanofskybacteria bacterium]|nr:serine hydrolase [Candidatus Yanofskybacteria bacterium]
MINKAHLFGIAAAVLGAINVFSFLNVPASQKHEALSPLEPFFNTTQAYVLPVSEPLVAPLLKANIAKPVINAKSALIFDVQSGRFLFDRNSKERIPVASLTKIMSAVVAMNSLNLKDSVTVEKESVRVDRLKQDLYAGEIISVEDLLSTMLVGSSNDAAHALAAFAKTKDFDFVAKMNERAQALDMKDTLFLDSSGLNDNGYSTAQDFTKLLSHALEYPGIWSILREPEFVLKPDGAIERQIKNTNQLLSVISGIVGGKTGYTDGALGCMILAVNMSGKHDTLVIIVLGSTTRFEDTTKLFDWATAAYRWQ